MNFGNLLVFGKVRGKPLVAEAIGQGERLPAHFLCPMDKHCCLAYHFSASKLIFFYVILN